MTPRPIIATGNMELDSKLGGGLPAGSFTLIEGTSAAGKSVLTQQIMCGALKDNLSVALFTSENSVQSLVTQMQSIDLDILDFLLLRKFRVYPMALAPLGAQAPAVLLNALRHEKHHNMIVIDSFTSAVAQDQESRDVLRFFETCKKLCSDKLTIIITLHTGSLGADVSNRVRSMCDAHLQLRTEQDGQRLVKTLEVTKIRGAASATGAIVGFEVEPGWGMRVIPISKARG